jgi:hypothetical protein
MGDERVVERKRVVSIFRRSRPDPRVAWKRRRHSPSPSNGRVADQMCYVPDGSWITGHMEIERLPVRLRDN